MRIIGLVLCLMLLAGCGSSNGSAPAGAEVPEGKRTTSEANKAENKNDTPAESKNKAVKGEKPSEKKQSADEAKPQKKANQNPEAGKVKFRSKKEMKKLQKKGHDAARKKHEEEHKNKQGKQEPIQPNPDLLTVGVTVEFLERAIRKAQVEILSKTGQGRNGMIRVPDAVFYLSDNKQGLDRLKEAPSNISTCNMVLSATRGRQVELNSILLEVKENCT